MTTTDITDDQILALRHQALAAGDLLIAAVCDGALEGDAKMRAYCAQALNPLLSDYTARAARGHATQPCTPVHPDEVEWPHSEGDVAIAYLEPGYRADDGHAELHLEHSMSAKAAARAYAAAYDPGETTYWVRIRVWRRAVGVTDAGELVYGRAFEEVHRVAIHPPQPACVDLEGHDWRSPYAVVGGSPESPGVWLKGAGIIERKVCASCGVYVQSDTWATDPATGEQGLHAIRYEDPDTTSLAWLEARAARKDG